MGLTIFPANADRSTRIVYAGAAMVAMAVLAFLFGPFLPVGGPFGCLAARRDISHGQLAYRASLRNPGWKKEWKAALEKTYGIHLLDGTAGCFRVPFLDSYEQAYNRTQLAAIRQAYGFDVIALTREQAYREWKARAEGAPPAAVAPARFSPMLSRAEFAAIGPAASIPDSRE